MEHNFQRGDLIRYIRTDALYLLLDEVELSKNHDRYRKPGTSFRVIVLFSGRSYPKNNAVITIFIPEAAPYYEVLSAGCLIL